MALLLGDDTAKRAGRLTLNPIAHVDPFGTVILPLILSLSGFGAFGYAKPRCPSTSPGCAAAPALALRQPRRAGDQPRDRARSGLHAAGLHNIDYDGGSFFGTESFGLEFSST